MAALCRSCIGGIVGRVTSECLTSYKPLVQCHCILLANAEPPEQAAAWLSDARITQNKATIMYEKEI
eukprot:scaffold126164_cov37-Prasinocladus_malaysianus.AAC.2